MSAAVGPEQHIGEFGDRVKIRVVEIQAKREMQMGAKTLPGQGSQLLGHLLVEPAPRAPQVPFAVKAGDFSFQVAGPGQTRVFRF